MGHLDVDSPALCPDIKEPAGSTGDNKSGNLSYDMCFSPGYKEEPLLIERELPRTLSAPLDQGLCTNVPYCRPSF